MFLYISITQDSVYCETTLTAQIIPVLTTCWDSVAFFSALCIQWFQCLPFEKFVFTRCKTTALGD